MRTDESSYKILYNEAENISSIMNIRIDFAVHRTMSLRSSRYQSENSATFDPKEKYKIDFFFYIIDVTLNSLEDRFEQLEMLDTNFRFLSDISKPITMEHCLKLEKILTATIPETNEIQKDIIAKDLLGEIDIFKSLYPVLIMLLRQFYFGAISKLSYCI